MSHTSPLGVLILNGGASTRMGADKGNLDWFGRSAVERCRAVAKAVGAGNVIVVGPGGDVEDPRQGPVGGVLAGAAVLARSGARRALVLAVDAPTVTPDDLLPLLEASDPGAAYDGMHLPMALSLDAIAQDAERDWPLARLVERAGLVRLVAAPGAAARLRGANTPDERAHLLEQFRPRDT